VKDYSGYIFAAYAFSTIVIGALIVKISLDYRRLRRELARLDDREARS
jgi:heme exporter protein CcmD